jgi:hypothetical protein
MSTKPWAVGIGIVVVTLLSLLLYWLRRPDVQLPGTANLINGGFENVNGQFNSDFTVNVRCKNLMQLDGVPPRNRAIAGWTVIGATGLKTAWRAPVIQPECNIHPSEGQFFLDLANDTATMGPTAGVQQHAEVTRRGAFELSLAVGARSSPVKVEVRAEQGGKTLASITCSAAPAGSGINWQPCTLPTFTAETSFISPGTFTNGITIVIGGPSQGSTAFIGVDNVVLRGR